jgi:hypothetical protein
VDQDQVRERVLELAEELHGWWMAALHLRVDRAIWDDLAPAFQRGHETAGAIIAGWYRDALLIRCRRLLAKGDSDEESPRRTLSHLAELAEHLNAELLAEAWTQQGTTLNRELVVEQVDQMLSSARADGRDPLDPASIAADARRLEEDFVTIKRFTSRAVAHQDRRRHRVATPTVADVDVLIEDVLMIVQRHAAVFAGVHLDTTDPGVSIRPTVRALQLFDWPAFVEAVDDETRRRFEGTVWPPQAHEVVDAEAQVRYVWPDAE